MRFTFFPFRRSKYHHYYVSGTRGSCQNAVAHATIKRFSSITSINPSDIPKSYEPSLVEDKILKKWENRKSKNNSNAAVFRMILPPPNVTGKLHLGHSLTLAVEDTIARWKVMKGFNVEWIPGFDHAGIATHSVVARKLLKTKTSSNETTDVQMELQNFANENLVSIREQLKSMGAILDWDSTYYTLDDNHSQTVREAFIQLFDSGLIKRGDGIVNWSCALGSSVADVEVDQIDFKGKTTIRVPGYDKPITFGVLYYCSYPVENSNESLIVATSRPETMFGDVALAVNPVDSRYAKFIGMTAIHPLTQRSLPIIGDSRVKTDFGSGVVKITPAHDKLDFVIGQSHNLEKLNVFTADGLLNDNCDGFKGLPRFAARAAVLKQLEETDTLKTSKDYSGAIGLCTRTGDVIEPRILPHWFLQTRYLTEKFVEAIKNGQFVIAPDNHSHNLLSKLAESQDWCLSRQIPWGHNIPAYCHLQHPDQWVSAKSLMDAKTKLETKLQITITNDVEIIQDTDVLDTWFSSALIPVSLSGWPDSDELKKISLLETGSDILLFWVWRMAIVTLGLVDTLPFNHVLLHGIVTDHYGRKMSKSRGNVIDPMHVVKGISFDNLISEAKKSADAGDLAQNEYDLRIAALKKDYPEGFKVNGTDALRFSLLSQDIFNQEIKMDIAYLENCRHFTNKMWQALRFYMIHSKDIINPMEKVVRPKEIIGDSVADQWLLACLYDFIFDAEKHLDKGRFHLYADSVRKFFYLQLCDVYIELVKSELKSGFNVEQHILTMRFALDTSLKIIHPLMPFVSEEIWSHLTSGNQGLLIDQEFPSSEELEEFRNPEINELINKTMKLVKEIRSAKTRVGIKTKDNPVMYLEVPSADNTDLLKMVPSIETLSVSQIRFDSPPATERSSFLTLLFQLNGESCRISTAKGDLMFDASGDKYKVIKLQKQLSKLKQKYENPSFQLHAPVATKEKLRKKVELLQHLLNGVDQNQNEDSQSPPNPSHP